MNIFEIRNSVSTQKSQEDFSQFAVTPIHLKPTLLSTGQHKKNAELAKLNVEKPVKLTNLV